METNEALKMEGEFYYDPDTGEILAPDDDKDVTPDRLPGIVEADRGGRQGVEPGHRRRPGHPRRPHGPLDEDLAGLGLEVLVQKPDSEPLPCTGGDEVVTELGQACAIVIAQRADIGGIHVV